MTEDKVFEVLNEIKSFKKSFRMRDDSRLVELFEMTVSNNRDRLENARSRTSAAETNHAKWTSQVQNAKKRLAGLEEDFKRVKSTCEQLESGVMLSSNNQQDVHEMKNLIANERNLLQFCKNSTGVHFDPPLEKGSVTGFVAHKGEIPSESTFYPFVIDKKSSNIPQEIWRKVYGTVENKPAASVIPTN